MKPPELEEDSRDDMKCAPGERVIMKHVCPWCGADLELRDRTTWARDCPECDYIWIPGLVDES